MENNSETAFPVIFEITYQMMIDDGAFIKVPESEYSIFKGDVAITSSVHSFLSANPIRHDTMFDELQKKDDLEFYNTRLRNVELQHGNHGFVETMFRNN